MSAIVQVPVGGNNKKIYFIYNFQQVDDFIIVVMHDDTAKRWQQFVVHYVDGRWETDVLAACTDEETFRQICWKLGSIFDEQANYRAGKEILSDDLIQKEATFLLELDD